MDKESSARRYWAKNLLYKSDRPFDKETLEKIGEVEGVTKRLSDGKLMMTAEMTAELTSHISNSRKSTGRRLKLVPLFQDEEKPDSSNN